MDIEIDSTTRVKAKHVKFGAVVQYDGEALMRMQEHDGTNYGFAVLGGAIYSGMMRWIHPETELIPLRQTAPAKFERA